MAQNGQYGVASFCIANAIVQVPFVMLIALFCSTPVFWITDMNDEPSRYVPSDIFVIAFFPSYCMHSRVRTYSVHDPSRKTRKNAVFSTWLNKHMYAYVRPQPRAFAGGWRAVQKFMSHPKKPVVSSVKPIVRACLWPFNPSCSSVCPSFSGTSCLSWSCSSCSSSWKASPSWSVFLSR